MISLLRATQPDSPDKGVDSCYTDTQQHDGAHHLGKKIVCSVIHVATDSQLLGFGVGSNLLASPHTDATYATQTGSCWTFMDKISHVEGYMQELAQA